VQIALALVLTIVSAGALNLGYVFQHDVAASVPALSLRRPIASLRSLLREPRWLIGFGVQAGGFVLYVVALALAPLSLVQATAAGGIGILAIMVSRITHVPLTRYEQIGAAVSVVGLALLGISLFSSHGEGSGATSAWVGIWLGASAAGAVLCVTLLARAIGRGPAWGIASGILFAAGDVATKMAVSGGLENAAFLVCLIVFYGAGSAVLQGAFQHGGALTTAGLSTLMTNALPIAAGMVLFHEPLPSGWSGAVRIAAFAAVVAGAVLLAAHGKETEPRPRGQKPPGGASEAGGRASAGTSRPVRAAHGSQAPPSDRA
jgi:drug/metabolite transporter (DMT)-like permease